MAVNPLASLRGGVPRITRDPVTARVVRVDGDGVWVVPLDAEDMRTPIGPCRGAAGVNSGDVVLLVYSQERPWAVTGQAGPPGTAPNEDGDILLGLTGKFAVHRAGTIYPQFYVDGLVTQVGYPTGNVLKFSAGKCELFSPDLRLPGNITMSHGAWQAPAGLEPDFTSTPDYGWRLTADGYVEFRGGLYWADNGGFTAVDSAALPADVRPAADKYFPSLSGLTPTMIRITTAGLVQVTRGSTTGVRITFDGVRYPIR